MIGSAGEPAVVYVAVVLAAALVLIEIALPTVGLAGGSAVALIAVAVWAVRGEDVEWWPLVFTAVAVGLWGVMIARRSAPPGQQIAAGAVFALGSFVFAGVEGDTLTVVLAVLASVGLPLGFPVLFRHAKVLFDRPSVVGMESHVGQVATVGRWSGTTGTILLEGSRWNAAGPVDLHPGDTVAVTGFESMHFTVRAAPPHQEEIPMTLPRAEES